jgi:adenylate cyclase
VAGDVFTAGTSAIVSDAYADPRFNKTVDEETGFKTESILCVPIRAEKGDIIGVVQALNKLDGAFNEDDKRFLEELAVRAADTLNNTQFAERLAPGFKRWLADLWQAWAATRDWR